MIALDVIYCNPNTLRSKADSLMDGRLKTTSTTSDTTNNNNNKNNNNKNDDNYSNDNNNDNNTIWDSGVESGAQRFQSSHPGVGLLGSEPLEFKESLKKDFMF